MAEISYRIATKNDLPEVVSLCAMLYEESEGGAPSAENAEIIFDRITRYPDYRIYLAEINGDIVGTFTLLIFDNLGHGGAPSAIVENVVVSPEYRGRGIGKRMMDFAMQRARDAGCYKLALSTNVKREEAHRFYESLGYKRHGYSYLIEIDKPEE
jgi:GNAT superfamily N-acetyltransferase